MADQGPVSLPRLMVAPNGARKTKADHPEVPLTIDEIVATAAACFAAGAGGLHAHVRDAAGAHVLDAGLYRELLDELSTAVPDMLVQITTEAVGRFSPTQQRQVVEAVRPVAASVALGEMLADGEAAAGRFYHWAAEADIAIQHILYDPEEVSQILALVRQGVVPAGDLQLMFVLGRYSADQQSDVSDVRRYVGELGLAKADWAVCAFGQAETACLAEAFKRGGKARVGFENSLWNADGSVAADNAERVREVAAQLPA